MLNDQDLQKVRQRVGWFMILGVSLIIGLLLLMSVRTDVFSQKFSLYVRPLSAASFHVGQAVRLHGFRVGSVQHIQLQTDGTVSVQLSILEKYRSMLHVDVKARSIKEGFIGELSLELVPGKILGVDVVSDSNIHYEPEVSIEHLLQEMKPTVEHAGTLLKEMAALSTWLSDPYGDVRMGAAQMRLFSTQLQGIKVANISADIRLLAQELQQITQQVVDQKTVENTNRVLLKTETMLEKLEPLIQKLGHDGVKVVQKSAVMVDELDILIQTLNRISSDVVATTPRLAGLVDDTTKTVSDMQYMAKRLRASWFFSGDEEKQSTPVHTDPVLDFRP